MAFKMSGFSAFTKETNLPEEEQSKITSAKTGIVAGQFLNKVEGGYVDRDSGKVYKDPKGVINVNEDGHAEDNDFIYKGNTIIGINVPKEGE